ncbi:unnamed protein product, partial [Brachionus calyciflorus]
MQTAVQTKNDDDDIFRLKLNDKKQQHKEKNSISWFSYISNSFKSLASNHHFYQVHRQPLHRIHQLYQQHQIIQLFKQSDQSKFQQQQNHMIKSNIIIVILLSLNVHQHIKYNKYEQFGAFLRKFGANILQHPSGVCVHKGRIVVVECIVMRRNLVESVKFDPNVEIINPENNQLNSTNCIEEIRLQNKPNFKNQTNCCDKYKLNEINTLNFNEQSPNEKTIYDLTELYQGKQINEFELNKMRERIIDSLKTVSANSVIDLEPNKNNDFAFKIELIDPNTKPITTKCRLLPYNLKNKIKEEIENQLKAGISTSEWSSALRIVIKPDGSIRITVDYKQLNKLIRGDSYPLPSIEDLFNKLSEADVFSKFDLKSASHQIPVHKDSIKYTAFICEFGL